MVVCELLEGRLLEHCLLPQVGGQVGVGLGNSCVGGLGKVTKSSCGACGRCVAVLDTRHLKQLLGHGGGHDASTTGGGDQSHPDGATLASHLTRHGVRASNLVAPEATPDRHDGKLSHDDCAPDGSGNLLGALHTQTHMAIVVANSDKSLESGPLSGPGLLLHRHDLENLILQRRSDEEVDNLVLFDWQGEEVNLLKTLDASVLNQPTQLGDRDPFLLFLAPSTSAPSPPAPSTTPASTVPSSSPAPLTKASPEA